MEKRRDEGEAQKWQKGVLPASTRGSRTSFSACGNLRWPLLLTGLWLGSYSRSYKMSLKGKRNSNGGWI